MPVSTTSTSPRRVKPVVMQKTMKSMESLPVPAFYCCYLLRSTVSHQILYCGSTPNLLRRIRQHNGIKNGGAKQTGKKNLRPWEVTCIVQGFPSKIAALQFEWAWQNTHITRHIAKDSRINQPKVIGTGKHSTKTGKEKTKLTRPSMSLHNRLQNLHLLLRSKSFERWPLSLRFFCEDVYKVYCKHTAEKKEQLRSGIEVVLDENATKVVSKKKKDALVEPAAAVQLTNPIELMEFGYSSLKPHLEKSKAVLDPSAKPICSICKSGIVAEKSFAVVCPHTDCSATSHLHCLSADFLRQENNSDSIIPISGNCPSCHTHTQWSSLVRELSLRKRGGKEIEKLFKIPRRKKGDAVNAAVSAMVAKERDDDEEEQVEGDESEEERRFEEFEAEASMIDLSESSKRVRRRSKSPSLEIKDSDWDDIDELD